MCGGNVCLLGRLNRSLFLPTWVGLASSFLRLAHRGCHWVGGCSPALGSTRIGRRCVRHCDEAQTPRFLFVTTLQYKLPKSYILTFHKIDRKESLENDGEQPVSVELCCMYSYAKIFACSLLCAPQSEEGTLAPAALRKLMKEMKTLTSDPPEGIRVEFSADNIMNISAEIDGPGLRTTRGCIFLCALFTECA